MDTLTLSVHGLNVNAVTKALRQTRGVAGVSVDLGESVAVVTYDETETTAGHLEQVVSATHHRSN
ncbi:heavy-metal-associated domain-containing protein [Alicyclobacillus ferrooxydans]|uniref:HMA domain-containing protein n=1 Tax=Alicyclobacillus ferrooxydans TaxID=471514 RepID=A0A0P9CYT2_9BACL|nr:heavy metal-associated domain-containing protein [Alicyclobacillus ferrooxydans]KPV42123.1 hypothetical protein AN477_18910 [Alicyclobacillus ferrooxydans]